MNKPFEGEENTNKVSRIKIKNKLPLKRPQNQRTRTCKRYKALEVTRRRRRVKIVLVSATRWLGGVLQLVNNTALSSSLGSLVLT